MIALLIAKVIARVIAGVKVRFDTDSSGDTWGLVSEVYVHQ